MNTHYSCHVNCFRCVGMVIHVFPASWDTFRTLFVLFLPFSWRKQETFWEDKLFQFHGNILHKKAYFPITTYSCLCSYSPAQLSWAFGNETLAFQSSDSTHCPCHKGKNLSEIAAQRRGKKWDSDTSCKLSITSSYTDCTLTYIYEPIWCLHRHVASFWKLSLSIQLQKDRYCVSEQALNDQNLFIAAYCVGSHPLAVCLDHRRCWCITCLESKTTLGVFFI